MLFSLPIQLSVVRYNYSYYGEMIHSAPGMNFATYYNQSTLGVVLSSPEDIIVYEDIIYMVDSKANSLVVVDENFDLVNSYTNFQLSASYIQKLMDEGITEFVDETMNSTLWY